MEGCAIAHSKAPNNRRETMSTKLLSWEEIIAGGTLLTQPPISFSKFREVLILLSSQLTASAQPRKRGAEDQSGSSGQSNKDTGVKKRPARR